MNLSIPLLLRAVLYVNTMDTAAAAQAQPRAAAAALVSEEKYKLLKRRLREVSEVKEREKESWII